MILFLSAAAGHAQQRIMYTQYMFNGLILNPAYAGTDKFANITAQGRQQWSGYKGAPNSQMISAHMPLPNKKTGLGVLLEKETMGVTDVYHSYVMYSYKLKMRKSTLSFGLQAGVATYREELTTLSLPAGSNDPNFANTTTYTQPNFGAGIYYYSHNFYLGFSVPSIMQNILSPDDPLVLSEVRHYFLTCGYLIKLSPTLKLKPNFLLKAVGGAPINLDMNLNLLIDDVVWVGCSYRMENAVNPLVEVQLNKKLRFGLSYDIPISDIGSADFRSASPEVMINYRFVKLVPNTVVSPRYF